MPYPDDNEIAIGGIILNGPRDAHGVLYTCATLDGWGSPGGTGGVQQRAAAHGGTNPRQWYTPRTLTLTGLIKAPDRGTRQRAEMALQAALGLDLFVLTVTDAISLRVRARRNGEITRVDDTDTQTTWQAELICPDPRRYGTSTATRQLLLPASAGGVQYPAQYPLNYPGVAISGDIRVVNAGNAPAAPRIRLDGPLTNPVITNITTGQSLTYHGTLAVGEFVLIGMDPQRALLMGTASRTGWLSGAPWSLIPGDNVIGFRATTGTGTGLLSYDDAYL